MYTILTFVPTFRCVNGALTSLYGTNIECEKSCVSIVVADCPSTWTLVKRIAMLGIRNIQIVRALKDLRKLSLPDSIGLSANIICENFPVHSLCLSGCLYVLVESFLVQIRKMLMCRVAACLLEHVAYSNVVQTWRSKTGCEQAFAVLVNEDFLSRACAVMRGEDHCDYTVP